MHLTTLPNASYSAEPSCSSADIPFSPCGSTDGTSVQIEGTQQYEQGGSGGGASDNYEADNPGSWSGTPDTTLTEDDDPFNNRIGVAQSIGGSTPTLPTVIHISELAQVQPTTASIQMEPQGWALLGSPTNFWIERGSPTVTATLFGLPVEVAFTPIQVNWNYGDGTTTTTHTLGASWQTLGLSPYTTTETSHTYRTPGTYTVTATIHYQATIHIQGQRIDVTGTVQQVATTAAFDTYRFDTVLVPNP